MENNNFQNNVNNMNNENNVTENVKTENENIEKDIKKGKRKSIVLIVILLILMLLLGLVGGLFISGNGDKVVDNIIHITEKKEENNTSKKIDESKDWVYDADYLNDKKEIVKTNKENNLTFKSTKEITLPYININSDDAKKANEEIKKIAEKAYDEFGEPLKITDGLTKKVTTDEDCFTFKGYKYENYINDNILSVVIREASVAVPGDGTISYITYNFDLETLKLINVTDILEKYGFKTQADFNNIIKIEVKNMEANGEGIDYDYSEWDGKRFFVKDGKINVVVPGIVMAEQFIVVDSNAVDKGSTISKESYFEQNKNLNYTSNPKDNINGKVAIIKMGEKTFQTTKNEGYYTYTDNFGNSYNIKEITNITSEYRMTSNDGATNLFKAVIEYVDNNNAKKSFDTAVFVPNDANNYITLSIYGPYENYTGTTNFVKTFTDLYDDGSKLPNRTSKIVKQLSPSGWAGSSMQEVRLYDNGDAYHVVYTGEGNTDENISYYTLIARNVDTIEEKKNGLEVESIIVKGKYLTKITNDGELWITFENN